MAIWISLSFFFSFQIPLGFASDLNQFETLTSASSGGVAQWFGLNGTFSMDSAESDFDTALTSNQPTKAHSWGWRVSAEINYLTQSVHLSDLGLFGSMGLSWQAVQDLEFYFDLLFGSVTNENYQTLGGIFKLEYHLPLYPHLKARDIYSELYSETKSLPYDPDDARDYFRHQREELDRENRIREKLRIESEFEARSQRVYPDLIFNLNLGIKNNLKSTKGLSQQTGDPIQEFSLNQIRIGSELTYAFSSNFSLGLQFDFFIYDSDIDQFTSSLKFANSLKAPLFNDGTKFSNEISSLFFPNAVTSIGFKWKLSQRNLINLQLKQLCFGRLNQTSALAFNPAYDHDFTANWQAGLGAYLLGGYGNPHSLTGILHLAYKL